MYTAPQRQSCQILKTKVLYRQPKIIEFGQELLYNVKKMHKNAAYSEYEGIYDSISD